MDRPITSHQEEALALSKGLGLTPANLTRVARKTDQASAAWAFEQWALRKRGLRKFAKAEEMLFTKMGVEMATHEAVARWRAERFSRKAEVIDLTCGIGGDLMALAKRGPAVGYETDPIAAAYARHNLALYGLTAEVREADGLTAMGDFAFADPMRRDARGRKSDASQFQPDPSTLAESFKQKTFAAIKLSPMLDDDYLESLGPGLEFVSHQGECCEALVWCGLEAEKGRWAVHVESGESLSTTKSPVPSEILWYIAEPDPAAIRAHCLGSWPGHFALADSHGYLTTDQRVESVWLTYYEVIWQGPYHLDKVQNALKQHDLKLTAIKKRRVDLEPAKLIKQIKSTGKIPAVLILYPQGRKVMAAIGAPPPPLATNALINRKPLL